MRLTIFGPKNWVIELPNGDLHLVENRALKTFMDKFAPGGANPDLWMVQKFECEKCRYDWLGVLPADTKEVECPDCREILQIEPPEEMTGGD